MIAPGKPRPDLVDRATVEAMIAAAVAAERAQAATRAPLAIRTGPTLRRK